ncbi:DUF365 domain-containing protein [Methanothermobacter wolfeii]|uniref:DUF365 domain-containing protein n=2 Tax=Methanothermobacter TaxID=145260 RepID=A0ABU8TWV6_METWO|nr:DUF365 domain-containing protein [Methanothermobacter defluvii]REE28460.1 hypothetical protein C7452_0471 [Methanothermobacter defluvii]SCM57835.1 putative protein {ECO:0000313/EMBL:CEA14164,1} [Methanothermobacter wolfeii]
MIIKGVTHPVPTEYAKRIYDEGKDVFVCKPYLGRVSPGDKFVIYESHGAKAYTGWADIVSIQKMPKRKIISEYGERLMLTEDEFRDYSRDRKEMTIIEFKNFEKFRAPVKPKRFISIGGKYIREDEYKMVEENRG